MLKESQKLDAEAADMEEKVKIKEEEIQSVCRVDNEDEDDDDDDDDDTLPLARIKSLESEKRVSLELADSKINITTEKNITLLCDSIVDCTTGICTDMRKDAEAVRDLYKPLLTLFAACHRLYSLSRQLTESEIKLLGD
ncbi:uncharacterized protein [Ptychodera flava]|uniref:uncharacterized protein n=1 Tax=Ptychodera flava TaxID=63121 RepID=UPI00396A9871